MNRATQRRIDLAKSLSKKIPEVKHLHAILIGGSVAKGWADDYSDLEICLCWEQLPSIEIRKEIISRFGGKIDNLFNADVRDHPLIFEDGFTVNNLHIDMWHCTNSGIENCLQEVLVNFNPNLALQETLFSIQNGIILKDSDQLQDWKTRINYPKALSIKYVEPNLSTIVRPDLQLHALRDDIMIYYSLFSGIQGRIIHVLYGLNGVFYQGLKNTEAVLQNLTIKPVNCWTRYRKIYEVSATEAVQIMSSLIEEVISLVEENLPELDVSDIKKRFNTKRILGNDRF